MTGPGALFDDVPDLYDDVRPDYPDALYAAVEGVTGPIAGRRVLDLAAGPGLATRQLQQRGARVVALDSGHRLLRRLRSRAPQTPAVQAVAEALPLRAGTVELVTCATAWHWLDPARVLPEVRRVLVPGGHLALWWANNRHGDGVEWEDAQSAVYERWAVRRGSRPPGHTGAGPREAAADLRRRGVDVVAETEVTWEREVDRDTHLRVLRTHSDVLALGADADAFVAEVAAVLEPWPVVTERLWGPLVVARAGHADGPDADRD